MTVPNRERERRDWSLIIFIIPLGIILIVIVGQLAIRIFPNLVINADMRSNLDPNSAPGQPASLLQPLLPQILTPMAWAEIYLTPGAGGDVSFPPFIILEPTSTPTSTPVSPSPTSTTPSPSPTTTTPSPTSTVIYTPTPTDDDDDDDNETPSPTATTPSPSPTATTPSPSPTTPSPTPTGYPSTPDPSLTQISPTPAGINLDVPNGSSVNLANGAYIVIDIGSNPIVVSLTPDNNYDLVFYESQYNFNSIHLDHIIIGISEFSDASLYYQVFNWGDGIPDMNTNVGAIAGSENDNQTVLMSALHDPDDAGPAPSTGILIDVDNASSEPPPNTYNYIVIISPISGSGDAAQIDAIVVTEIPIPTP